MWSIGRSVELALAGQDGGPNTLLIVITAAAAALILALTMALFWLWRTGRI